MAAGNGTHDHEADVRPPFPRRPLAPEDVGRKREAEMLRARMAEAVENERQNTAIKGQPAPVEPTPAFLQRIENAAELLADIGNEMGKVGADDEQTMRNFASTLQQHTQRYIGQLVERKRRELADLERILGKL